MSRALSSRRIAIELHKVCLDSAGVCLEGCGSAKSDQLNDFIANHSRISVLECWALIVARTIARPIDLIIKGVFESDLSLFFLEGALYVRRL